MRIALLPTRGDPFALKFFFYFFEKYWQDEVDKLIVNLNSPLQKDVVDFINGFMTKNKKVIFTYTPYPLEHGGSLKQMFQDGSLDVNNGEEIILCFLEDDFVIFKHGVVNEHFKKIENKDYDYVGAYSGSSTLSLYKQAQEYFKINEPPYYRPCFFFSRKTDILRTNLHFKSKSWEKGEYIKEIDWISSEHTCADTFVWFSLQLRNLKLKHFIINQYFDNFCEREYLELKERQEGRFDPLCDHLHIGSMCWHENFLTDDLNVPIAYRTIKNPPIIPRYNLDNWNSAELIIARLSWVTLFLKYFGAECDDISEFRESYKRALNSSIEFYKFDRQIIERRLEDNRHLVELY